MVSPNQLQRLWALFFISLSALAFMLGVYFFVPHIFSSNIKGESSSASSKFSQTKKMLPKIIATSPKKVLCLDSIRPAYSLWLRPPEHLTCVFSDEIEILGRKYNGRRTAPHFPHLTLHGAVFTTNETYVKEIAKELSRSIPPFKLHYNFTELKLFNPTHQFRGGIAIRYKSSVEVTDIMKRAAEAYGSTKAQVPHLTLLYDYDGGSFQDKNSAKESEARLLKSTRGKVFSWMAHEVEVWYTPLRDHFRSSEDMRNIVSSWKYVAKYPLLGSDAVSTTR
jgi:2'-5' RNA ligase